MYRIGRIIGNTKIIRLETTEKLFQTKGQIYAKAEYLNPSGSIKDRAAEAIIARAERLREIDVGGTIVEATSGNMGISLAMIGASHGYRVKIIMPDTASEERAQLIRAYGADVIFTPGSDGMSGAIKLCEEIQKKLKGSFMPRQFENPECVLCHYSGTAPEIYRDLYGEVHNFIAGVGTGGTIIGVGKYLKQRSQDVRVIAVEPSESPTLSGGISKEHGIEGIGANFIPTLYDASVIDEVITISTKEAYEYMQLLTTVEGIFSGVSTGAAFAAAVKIAKREENRGKTTVFTINDRGDRYLSRLQ